MPYLCIIELMNPASGSPVPPDPEALTPDIPDAAFGFADDVQNTSQTPPTPDTLRPVTVPPRPTPVSVAPAPPRLAETPQPTPAPIASAPLQPAPAPYIPPAPQAAAVPLPTDVLPPRQVPPVPTLQPAAPAAQPITMPAPTPVPASAPQPVDILAAKPIPLSQNPLAAQPAQAAPVSASYSPTPVTHVPADIAERITETPIQNSAEVSKDDHANGRLKSLLSFLIFTAAIFVAAFLINQFIFQSYYVEGTSMTPTLQNNDRLIISKVERTLAAIQGKPYIPERGQIVVLDSSIVGLNGQKEQLIKRVIGLPGDHIHIDAGVVTITNSQHPDGYDVTQALGLTNLHSTYSDSPIDLTVPNNQVYVMGDNREQGGSYDSRSFGPIDGDKIQGRLWARILPFDHAQLF